MAARRACIVISSGSSNGRFILVRQTTGGRRPPTVDRSPRRIPRPSPPRVARRKDRGVHATRRWANGTLRRADIRRRADDPRRVAQRIGVGAGVDAGRTGDPLRPAISRPAAGPSGGEDKGLRGPCRTFHTDRLTRRYRVSADRPIGLPSTAVSRTWDFGGDLQARQGVRITVDSPFCDATRMDTPGRFSPDGSQVAFTSDRSGSQQVWVANRDGSSLRSVTQLPDATMSLGSWSPDSRSLTFDATMGESTHIYVVPLTADR